MLRSFFLIMSGFVILAAFQNCGQAGSLTQDGQAVAASKAVATGEGPLVVDVVESVPEGSGNEVIVPPPAEDDKECDHDGGVKQNEEVDGPEDVVDGSGSEESEDDDLDDYACGKKQDKKVFVCHHPEGTQNKQITLCISRNALQAHLNHGHQKESDQDHLGVCQESQD